MFVLMFMAEGKLLKFESVCHAIVWFQNNWNIVHELNGLLLYHPFMMFLRHMLWFNHFGSVMNSFTQQG